MCVCLYINVCMYLRVFISLVSARLILFDYRLLHSPRHGHSVVSLAGLQEALLRARRLQDDHVGAPAQHCASRAASARRLGPLTRALGRTLGSGHAATFLCQCAHARVHVVSTDCHRARCPARWCLDSHSEWTAATACARCVACAARWLGGTCRSTQPPTFLCAQFDAGIDVDAAVRCCGAASSAGSLQISGRHRGSVRVLL